MGQAILPAAGFRAGVAPYTLGSPLCPNVHRSSARAAPPRPQSTALPRSFVDNTLWPEYLQLKDALDEYLSEATERIFAIHELLTNMFENLDDVVLHVEARVLDALDKRLSSVLADGNPVDRVSRLAQAYLAFTHEKPRLWNLLFEHHMPTKTQLPSWYQQKLEGLMGRVEEAMAELFPPGREADRQRAARVLWAGVHGITSLSTADKLSVVTTETASRLVEDLINTYLAGLAAGTASRPAA